MVIITYRSLVMAGPPGDLQPGRQIDPVAGLQVILNTDIHCLYPRSTAAYTWVPTSVKPLPGVLIFTTVM